MRSLLAIAVLMYLLWGLFLYVSQRSLMYMPVGRVQHPYPVEQFSSGGETIEVAVLNAGMPDAVMYFGGNAESVVANAPGFQHHLPEHTVYLVNYRGYAGSSGTPTEEGLYADAVHIYDRIRARHRHISVIGRSLGAGVATYLASLRPVSRMVLVAPFDSILHIARDQFPVYPVSLMLKDRYDSYSRVLDIEAETLVVLAEYDAVIPARYSKRLIEAFPPSQVTVETIGGAGHNGLAARAEYYPLLAGFIEGARGR